VVDPHLRDIAILLSVAWLFTLTLYVLTRRVARERELEEELGAAHTEIAALRTRLTEATRPPTQFARSHMREVAVDRFARLRLAAPRRSRSPERVAVRERSR
jgi:hypothetical protein